MRRGSLVGDLSAISLDRYIPRRRGSSHDLSHIKLVSKSIGDSITSGQDVNGHESPAPNANVTQETTGAPTPSTVFNSMVSTPGSEQGSILNFSAFSVTDNSIDQSGTRTPNVKKHKRQLPRSPERVFDMPNIRNDYYTSPFAWSAQGKMGVALTDDVYIWNAPDGDVKTISVNSCDAWPQLQGSAPCITAVTWDPFGRYLALGTDSGLTSVWDSKKDQITSVEGAGLCDHEMDVQSMVWIKRTPHTILYCVKACGCIRRTTFENKGKSTSIKTIAADMYHEASSTRLCGVAVCPAKRHLVYSGSSGDIYVVNLCEETLSPHLVIEGHVSTVKALAFCQWQPSLLASGGGSRDGTIQGHKVTNGAKVFEIRSLPQVCNLVWSPQTHELISGHGEGEVTIHIWSYPSMDLVGSLQDGQMGRVLGLGISPDGCTLASLTSDDESLRLWAIAKKRSSPKKLQLRRNSLQLDSSLPGSPLAACIR